MSFIADIVKYGLGRYGITAKGDTARDIIESAASDFLKQKIDAAIKRTNPTASTSDLPARTQQEVERVTREVKVELKADAEAAIPVLYGEAYVEPLLVDARLTNSNCTMWYAVALCEVTGTKISDSTASEIQFLDVFWEGKRVIFQGDGVTVRGLHSNGTTDYEYSNLIKIYPYNNGSDSPCQWTYQPKTITHGSAYDLMPGWDSDWAMSNLAFALVRIDYDAATEVKGVNSIKFKLRNTMKKPGDVMYDYMTNTMYGAGIKTGEIDI